MLVCVSINSQRLDDVTNSTFTSLQMRARYVIDSSPHVYVAVSITIFSQLRGISTMHYANWLTLNTLAKRERIKDDESQICLFFFSSNRKRMSLSLAWLKCAFDKTRLRKVRITSAKRPSVKYLSRDDFPTVESPIRMSLEESESWAGVAGLASRDGIPELVIKLDHVHDGED